MALVSRLVINCVMRSASPTIGAGARSVWSDNYLSDQGTVGRRKPGRLRQGRTDRVRSTPGRRRIGPVPEGSGPAGAFAGRRRGRPRCSRGVGAERCAGEGGLGFGNDDRDGGAEFVGGVGRELLLLRERRFQPRERRVENPGKPAEFTLGFGDVDSLGQTSSGDSDRGRGDLLHRSQGPAGENPSAAKTQGQHRATRDREPPTKRPQHRKIPG